MAVAALAGCERADPPPAPRPPVIRVQRPAIAAQPRELPRAPEPAPIVEAKPVPVPKRTTARHHVSPTKQWFFGLSADVRQNVTAACAVRAENRCGAVLARMKPQPIDDEDGPSTEPEPLPVADPVASLPQDKLDAYCKADFPAPTCETPLVVAFESQPIDFAPAGGESFAFVPGAPAATDWPTAVTPWIALDLDGDGRIASGAELFGSSTVLPGGGRASNGFVALAALDSNGDGVLDASDPMFGKLVLWSDGNGDHRSSPDELRPLSGVVTKIPLTFTRDARCNERDDCEGERGTLHWRDPAGVDHVGAVVDVYIPRS